MDLRNLVYRIAGFMVTMVPVLGLIVCTMAFGIKGFLGFLLLLGSWNSYNNRILAEEKRKERERRQDKQNP